MGASRLGHVCSVAHSLLDVNSGTFLNLNSRISYGRGFVQCAEMGGTH